MFYCITFQTDRGTIMIDAAGGHATGMHEGVDGDGHKRTMVCVLLCFIKPILRNRYFPGVSSCQQTLDNNLGVPDPNPPPSLRRWLYQSPSLPFRTDPASKPLTIRGKPCDGHGRRSGRVEALPQEPVRATGP